MTNDDLTPEEREALSSLPRERTPSAELEDRVVAAMRERGHLARKPARVIRLTTSRVAGLLAACLVLMIGAYSIGLHNRVNNEVLRNIEPEPRSNVVSDELKRDEGLPAGANENAPLKGKPAANVDQGFIDKKAPAFKPTLNLPQLATPKEEKKTARQDEAAESMERTFSQGLAKDVPGATDLSAPSSPPMPAQLRAKSSSVEASSAVSGPASTTRTFALSGGTLIVDAPDSLRIVQDEHGRTLVIYTSDGIIRIRLAD